jgi:putative peptidoglycan lipid II flippase
MTTPGHQARRRAAEGGRPRGTGNPPGDGSDRHDAGPPDDGYRYGRPDYDDRGYETSTGQFPVYGPLDNQYADYTVILPALSRRDWPRYDAGEGQHSRRSPADLDQPGYPPATERRPGRRRRSDPYPAYPPAEPAHPGYQAEDSQYTQFPSYGPTTERYPGQRPDPSQYPGYPPADDQYPGYGGEEPAWPAEAAWGGSAATQPEAGWAPGTTEREADWYPPDTQREPDWRPETASPETAWGGPAGTQAQEAWDLGPTQPEVSWAPARHQPPPSVQAAPGWTVRGTQPAPARAPAPGGASLLRSSSAMAMGTLASRVTGFVRSAILIYALGTLALGNAYNISNTLPNIVYQFALGGIFTSVVVPLLVNAARRFSDRGEAYDQRVFTLGVLALGGVTLVATVAAEPISAIYAGNVGNAATYHLTVILAYFFIPQIFFYGVSSLAAAILNARGSFAAPMWTPVINNLVVIVVGLGFFVIAGPGRTPSEISGGEVALLGIGTTLGIVLQTVALIPSLRRVGFRWRPRYDFRRAEVSEIGRMSGWMFGYVLTTQIAFLVTTRVANSGGAHVPRTAAGAGFAAYSNAYMLFQLPYAIVGISVITAMLPRMSAHAAEGRYGNVAADFSYATRLASVIVVPAALILAVLGGPLGEGLFGYGSTSPASARYLGEVFAVFSIGLLPYMLFQLLLRVFYAMHDSRTPALIGVVTMTVNITTNLIALAILPPQHVVAGLGACFGLSNLIGTVIAWRVIDRRIGGLDGYNIRSSLVRMHLAAIPSALFALAIAVMVNAVIPGGRLGALLTVAIGGSGALLIYVIFSKAARVTELSELIETVGARLR